MHNPENEFEFTQIATCPNGHTGEVEFHGINERHAPVPTGECEICDVTFPVPTDDGESAIDARIDARSDRGER